MNDTSSPSPPLPRLEVGLRLGLTAVLALLCLWVYLPALSAEFVYDDHTLIAGNRTVTSLSAALSSFFEPLWAFDPHGEIPNAFWRPLTVLLFAAVQSVLGLVPEAFHAVSLLLHVAATWAAWRLATRLLRCPTTGWVAAALFAVHPVHVESVAWASAVNDPLFSLFALLSLERYFAWRERGGSGVPWASGVLLLVSLLAKEQALAVPLVALVIDLCFRHLRTRGPRAGEELARAYGPWVAAVLLYVVGRMMAYGDVLAGFDEVSASYRLDLARAATLRVEILGASLESLFAPHEYRFFRQVRPTLPEGYGPWLRAVAAVVLWIVAVTVAVWQRRRLALAMLLAIPATFVLLLVDVEAAGAFPISDRFLYLPVAFAAVLVLGLLDRLLDRRAAVGLGLVAAGVAGWEATHRVELFRDDMTLYRAAVEAEPDNLRARLFLGNELLERYNETLEKEYLDEALFHYLTGQMLGFDYGERKPKLGPDEPYIARAKELDVLVNHIPRSELERDDTVFVSGQDRLGVNLGVGNAALAMGNLPPEYDREWPQLVFEQILEAYPDSPEAHDGLGRTLFYQGDYEGAEKAFRTALQKNGRFAKAWHNLGVLLQTRQRFDEARVCFDQALEVRPGHEKDLIRAAECAIDGRRFERAERYLQRLERLHPGQVDALYLRGVMRAVRGDLAGAVERFDAVIARREEHPRAHAQKGNALLGMGNREDAVRALRRAVELDPGSFPAHYQLAKVLLQNPEAGPEAFPYLERAYALSPPDTRRGELHRILHGLLLQASMSDEEALDRVVAYARLDQRRQDFGHALSWVESAAVRIEERIDAEAEEVDRRLVNNLIVLLNMRGELYDGLAENDEEKVEEYRSLAEESYRAGLGLSPRHFFLNYNLAVLLTKGGRPDQAAGHARTALENMGQLEGHFEPGALRAMRTMLEQIASREPQPGPVPDGER